MTQRALQTVLAGHVDGSHPWSEDTAVTTIGEMTPSRDSSEQDAHVPEHRSPAERLVDVADQVQEWAVEEL
jgi:hypothetical protein